MKLTDNTKEILDIVLQKALKEFQNDFAYTDEEMEQIETFVELVKEMAKDEHF